MERQQPAAFEKELLNLIQKYRHEWTITYSEVAGVLAHAAYLIHTEWAEEDSGEDDDGEGE